MKNVTRSVKLSFDEKTSYIFVEVKNKLSAYMDTPAYEQFLYQKIKDALAFADGEEIIIYIDPADEIHQHSLMQKLGIMPRLSRETFQGGMRAVIPSKNILIDNSFKTMLEDARGRFTFQDGGMSI